VSIKATSALSLVAIWAAMIPAVVANNDVWWTLIFAGLASGAVGIGMWRRLGISRLIAIVAVWASTGLVVAQHDGSAWMSVMALLATGAIVYSAMARTALMLGVGIGTAWAVTAATILVSDGDGTGIAVFAFLTAATVANTWTGESRGIAAVIWWGIAGAIMIPTQDWFWLSAIAWLLSTASIGIWRGGFALPRRFEWDLFERDDDGRVVR
jgi:hypothetical protein